MWRHRDSYPCPVEDTGYALTSLSRCPDITEFGWQLGRLWWEVEKTRDSEMACQHMQIAKHVQKAISLHKAQDWKP